MDRNGRAFFQERLREGLPTSIDELVDFVVARVLDHLGVDVERVGTRAEHRGPEITAYMKRLGRVFQCGTQRRSIGHHDHSGPKFLDLLGEKLDVAAGY
jgi:hypothetical protein